MVKNINQLRNYTIDISAYFGLSKIVEAHGLEMCKSVPVEIQDLFTIIISIGNITTSTVGNGGGNRGMTPCEELAFNTFIELKILKEKA